jgi:glutamyl/glutaminyl-tRNA synthetase
MVATMKYTTRFSPTVNGNLHVGHIFMALVNEYESNNSGGKFIVRFDDNQYYWNDVMHVDFTKITNGMIEDIKWLGIKVDAWESERDLFNGGHYSKEQIDKLESLDRKLLLNIPPEKAEYPDVPEVIGWNATTYPYAPFITAQKVAMDYIDGVNLLIRGIDLLTEFSLYEHYVEEFRLPKLRHVYLPRLVISDNKELTDISKTAGNNSIRQLRESGWTPTLVLESLKSSCLINPTGSWSIDNVKARPVWNE